MCGWSESVWVGVRCVGWSEGVWVGVRVCGLE